MLRAAREAKGARVQAEAKAQNKKLKPEELAKKSALSAYASTGGPFANGTLA